MTLTQDRRAALMGGCPLFRGLDDSGLGAIAAASIEVDFPAERVIARQGEIGTGFFLIVEGMVRVTRDGTHGRDGSGPASSSGSCRCSTADLGSPRSPPRSRRRCLALASWDFERVLRDEPGVALSVLKVVAGRLREVTADHRT